jgi:hypothetical protein
MSFQLNLAINPADLQALIDEGQQIVLVKSISIDFNTAPETNIVYDPAKGGFVLAGL